MEETSNNDWYEQHLAEERAKRIPTALTKKYEDPDLQQARLQQIHQTMRDGNQLHTWKDVDEERQTFLSSVGPFDPLMMSKSFGFTYEDKSYTPVDLGCRIAKLQKGNKEITLLKDPSMGKDKLLVRVHEKGAKSHEITSVPMPTTADGFYDLMHQLQLGFNFYPKDKSAHELAYVKNKKAKK